MDPIPDPDQIPWRRFVHAGLQQLPRCPFRRRMLGDIEMHQPTSPLRQHYQHEWDSKGRGGHREEIQRDQICGWFFKNVRHACDGGRSMYFETPRLRDR
jgi:hypothetical protein